MPLVHPTARSFFYQTITTHARRLAALEGQQNWGITDSAGKHRILAGLQTDKSFCIRVLDPTGRVRVTMGDLPDGDYGFSVTDTAGNTREVNPDVFDGVTTTLTYSTNAWGALSGAPSVEVVCGASGKIDMMVGGFITPGSDPAGETAVLAVSVNGAGPHLPQAQVSVGSSFGLGSSAHGEWVSTGWTPGTAYTISLMAWVSTAGVVAKFSNLYLRAKPV